jgi:acyl-coenzyme A thioesterase PaaI-like protein
MPPEAPAFVPADPLYATRVRESFARQGAMATVGARLSAVAPGYCAIELVPTPAVSQQHGYVHAGVIAMIVVAEGFVVKSGRTLTIARGEVHAESAGRRTLVALMQQTLIAMHGKPDAPAA